MQHINKMYKGSLIKELFVNKANFRSLFSNRDPHFVLGISVNPVHTEDDTEDDTKDPEDIKKKKVLFPMTKANDYFEARMTLQILKNCSNAGNFCSKECKLLHL